ncbi:hypothetical protein [Neptuniibacter sp. QD37_11]|uniref:hypothetical protein n=1 Tax=Neptuniibacter sp. QD37_11 TaxID=3398209 RepID=UPI0039F44EF6
MKNVSLTELPLPMLHQTTLGRLSDTGYSLLCMKAQQKGVAASESVWVGCKGKLRVLATKSRVFRNLGARYTDRPFNKEPNAIHSGSTIQFIQQE